LWLADAGSLVFSDAPPAWATSAWLEGAPVVVRRASPPDVSLVPVGLRGIARHERCAAQAPATQVLRSWTPEAALRSWQLDGPSRRRDRACLQTLDALTSAWDALPLAWGVTGSVGFTLASGIDVLREDSDLDLLVRAPSAADATVLRDLASTLQAHSARIDVQVETPLGAFALLEWLRTGGPVLLKTDRGPVFSDDAWHLAERQNVA
jgi:phosphoribosyl-dephospho-CoA transferase